MNPVWMIVVCGLLLVLVAFSGIAVASLREFSRSRLQSICRQRGCPERFGLILARHRPASLVVGVIHVASLVALAVYLTLSSTQHPPAADDGGDAIGWLIGGVTGMGLLVLLTAVILPWPIARVYGETFLCRIWPVLRLLLVLLGPLVSIVSRFERLLHRLVGRAERRVDDKQTLIDEILSVVDQGHRGGVLEFEARTMIRRVMELQDEDAAAVMTPRTEIVHLHADATLEEARSQLLEAGHTRMPVIDSSTDDIVGILYAKDLLGYMHPDNDGTATQLRDIVREPFYVPETTGIDKLLDMLKTEQVHLAIVLDEYGGVAGLVTLEDVLEEIVGEIADEYDKTPDDPIRQISPGVTEVDARVHLDDLNEQFEYGLPEDGDYDTIGGFVISRLGRIPTEGEQVTTGRLRLTVDEADPRRVIKVRIEKLPASDGDEGDPARESRE